MNMMYAVGDGEGAMVHFNLSLNEANLNVLSVLFAVFISPYTLEDYFNGGRGRSKTIQ